MQEAQRLLCSQTSTKEPGMLNTLGCLFKGQRYGPVFHPEIGEEAVNNLSMTKNTLDPPRMLIVSLSTYGPYLYRRCHI